MNEQNLKPFTKENASAFGKIGGTVAGESKRKKKSMKECALLMGQLGCEDRVKEKLRKYGIKDDDELTNNMAVIYGMFMAAQKGNAAAVRALLELCGELEPNGVKIDINAKLEETEAYKKGYNDCMKWFLKRVPDDFLLKLASDDDMPEAERNPEVLAEIAGLTPLKSSFK